MIERPVLRYFGGKWKLAPWIISNFPPHSVYVEPFGGGGSVLMRKDRSKSEVYNDMDSEVVNVFQVLRDSAKCLELQSLLKLTPFSREEFNLAHEPCEGSVERARRTIVRSFMGHGADSTTRKNKSGFRAKSFGSNRDASKDWLNYSPQLPIFCERLGGVIIENREAVKVMEGNDGPTTLHYVDPPYPMDTRSSGEKHGYRFEMTNDDHLKLCEFLKSLKGMIVLSGYATELYSCLGWQTVTCRALADGAAERLEVLWLNDAAVKGHSQMKLFEATK